MPCKTTSGRWFNLFDSSACTVAVRVLSRIGEKIRFWLAVQMQLLYLVLLLLLRMELKLLRLDPTDLADVGSCQPHQRGKPVCDVQQSLGHSSPALQQRAVDESHAADSAFPVRSLESPQQEVKVFSPRWSQVSADRSGGHFSTLRPRRGQLLPPVNG